MTAQEKMAQVLKREERKRAAANESIATLEQQKTILFDQATYEVIDDLVQNLLDEDESVTEEDIMDAIKKDAHMLRDTSFEVFEAHLITEEEYGFFQVLSHQLEQEANAMIGALAG